MTVSYVQMSAREREGEPRCAYQDRCSSSGHEEAGPFCLPEEDEARAGAGRRPASRSCARCARGIWVRAWMHGRLHADFLSMMEM